MITRQKYIYEEVLTPKIYLKFKSLTLLCIHLPRLGSDPLQHTCSRSESVALVKPKLLSDPVFSNAFWRLMRFSPMALNICLPLGRTADIA